MSMKHLASSTSTSELSEFTEDQVQPNAIDLRLDKIFKITKNIPFRISEEEKSHRKTHPVVADKDGWYNLEEGKYEVIMEGTISMGKGEAGWVITRSTLNRNGCYITSGLYDSGYNGVMAGVLHVPGPTHIKKGTRIGQMLIFDAECLNMYDGSYGIGKEHDKKYE